MDNVLTFCKSRIVVRHSLKAPPAAPARRTEIMGAWRNPQSILQELTPRALVTPRSPSMRMVRIGDGKNIVGIVTHVLAPIRDTKNR